MQFLQEVHFFYLKKEDRIYFIFLISSKILRVRPSIHIKDAIVSYIESHEGVHYSLIKKALNLKNGTLSYHLHLLEKEGVIFSKKIGKYRVFYVKDFRKPYLTDIQKRILSLVEERGEISLGALRNEIDISRQLLSYHIKILNNFGYLGKKKKGKEVYIYIREKY